MAINTPSKQFIIGEIGEYIAWKVLIVSGFRVFAFGGGRKSDNVYKHKKSKAKPFTIENAMAESQSGNEADLIKSFHSLNKLITKYIGNEWERFNRESKPPFATYEISFAEKKDGKELADLMRQENRRALDQYRFSGGDLFDYVGIKDGKIYAIEVKVNSSPLLEGQKFRLRINKENGFGTMVARISISSSAIQKAESGSEPEFDECILNESLELSDCPIPSHEKLLEGANYVSPESQRYFDFLLRF